jgi:hypothetical protein
MEKINWNLGLRLWILSFSLIALTIVIGIVPFQLNSFYSVKIKAFAENVVPSMKDAVLADMLHDGIRANALQIRIQLDDKKNTSFDELAKEQKEMTKAFIEHLNNLSALSLNKETEATVREALLEAHKYVDYSDRFLE